MSTETVFFYMRSAAGEQVMRVDQIERGTISAAYVTSLDRLFRDRSLMRQFADLCAAHGILIVMPASAVDCSRPDSPANRCLGL